MFLDVPSDWHLGWDFLPMANLDKSWSGAQPSPGWMISEEKQKNSTCATTVMWRVKIHIAWRKTWERTRSSSCPRVTIASYTSICINLHRYAMLCLLICFFLILPFWTSEQVYAWICVCFSLALVCHIWWSLCFVRIRLLIDLAAFSPFCHCVP